MYRKTILVLVSWPTFLPLMFGMQYLNYNQLPASYQEGGGWSGGSMALGKIQVPGRPTILITVGQGPTALAIGGWGLFGHFYSHLSFLFSFSLSLGDGPI